MTTGVVLDAAAFDVIDGPEGAGLRHLLRLIIAGGGEVRCAAVTLAKVARGRARTRRIEVAVARDRGGQRVRVIPTDLRLAKLVGAVLHHGAHDSGSLADALVVAVSAEFDAAIVITSDPVDIAELAVALPNTRIVVRRPDINVA